MSKKTKARAKVKRAQEKRARKASMKTQYQAWAAAGITKGSKRQKSKKALAHKLLNPKKGGRKRIPFPVHLWLDKNGNLKPGAPHKAYLELQRQNAA